MTSPPLPHPQTALPAPSREALFYNAIAIACFGDARNLSRVRRGMHSWEDAYRAFRQGMLFPDSRAFRSLPDPFSEGHALMRAHVQILLASDPSFPLSLREIPYPPHALYIRGAIDAVTDTAIRNSTIAIVGTRNASPEGTTIARRFGNALTRANIAIVSGLAFGIDAAAHEGSLETIDTSSPDTSPSASSPPIAVLAGGLGTIHPRTHHSLAMRILAAGGALVSEYPLTESPLPRRFIARNRIVSGLSRGVLVVEAPEESGALSTARFAHEQNKDLFVVPGSTLERRYRGSHQLIRQGAELVTTPQDIMEQYGIVKERRTFRGNYELVIRTLPPKERLVCNALAKTAPQGSVPPDVDKIAEVTKLEPRIVNQSLTFLIMKGIIKEERGGFVIIAE